MITTQNILSGNAMRDKYDFSQGERGKFYRPDTKVYMPVYLDDDVQTALVNLAAAKGKDYSIFVNELLKKNIELIELAR